MKKGSEFEKRLDKWILVLNLHDNVSAVRNEVRFCQTAGKYIKKSVPDLSVFNGRKYYLIDVKECSAKYFYPSLQPEHQIREINKINRMNNGIAFFAVWFKKQDPIGSNIRAIRNTVDRATVEDGYRFDYMDLVEEKNIDKFPKNDKI